MKEKTMYDAVILNAYKEDGRVHGNVYCDRAERFYEGQSITTSPIIDQPGETVVRTKNSVYKVMWRA